MHGIGIASRLILTHGRGNPERLGSPPEYEVWVVGDAERSARYTISDLVLRAGLLMCSALARRARFRLSALSAS